MTEGNGGSGRRLKSVDRSFEIIEFVRTDGPTTLSAVADSFDMPMSTAHIHLSTLVENGYLRRDDGEYRCGLRFLRAGGMIRDRLPLFRAAKDEVDDLQERVGENANVGTIEDGYMVQLYKSENPESIDDNAPLGAHLYLHTTATGKAMLSQLSESGLDRILDRRGLPEVTASTITSRDELKDALEEVRDRGYATNREENFAGVCAVAVPILSKSGAVTGAISLSGPVSRMGEEYIDGVLAPELFDKRNIIELKLKQL